MRTLSSAARALGFAAAVVGGLALARAGDEKPAWSKTLEEGLVGAKTSGKAVLVVTLWKTGV